MNDRTVTQNIISSILL